MVKTSYTACAMRPEEFPMCDALDAGNYPQEYAEKVDKLLRDIKDDKVREKVRQTLGAFKAGSDGKLVQSSPYMLVMLQEELPDGKVLVARPRLQVAKEGDMNFMSGFYVDCGLNLVSREGDYQINPVPAKTLASELKKAGINLKDARLIPYNILTHRVDGSSPSGLVFKLSKKGKDIVRDSVLNTLDFKWKYLPSVSGLFRACLSMGDYWDASNEDLASSGGDGGVVVETTGEAGSHEIEEKKKEANALLERQKQERQELINRLSK